MNARRLLRRGAVPAGVTILSAVLFLLAHRSPGDLRFDIGTWDRALLVDPSQVYPPEVMSGPFRHPDMSVEVIEFVGRLARRRLDLALPLYPRGTALEIDVRCHRFGLGGTVVIEINGRFRDEAEFSKRSYPWAGVRFTLPREAAEAGPLRIAFEVVGGDPPGGRVPEDLGIGIDWIDVRALSEDAWFLPTPRSWGWYLLTLLLVAGLCRQLRLPWLAGNLCVLAVGVAISAAALFSPLWAARLLPYAWWPFPLMFYVAWIARLARQHPLALPTAE